MFWSFWKFLGIFCAFFFSISISQAATLYVSPTGIDGPGSLCLQTAPCRKIQTAINTASPGDVIQVGAGVYTEERGPVLSINKNLTIQGENTASTVIDGQDRVMGIFMHNIPGLEVTLSNMTITRMRDEIIYNTRHLILRNMLINHNNGKIINGSLDSFPGNPILEIQNSSIISNKATTIIINLSGNSKLSLINSTLALNEVNFSTITNASFLSITNSTIVNNEFAYPDWTGGIYLSSSSPSHTSIKGSIIAKNYSVGGASTRIASDCVAFDASQIISWGYNIIGAAKCSITTGSAGDLIGRDPHFVDPQLGSLADHGGGLPTYNLLPSSPALNAIPPEQCSDMTIPIPNLLRADERGIARPQGTGCEIGAYEFNPSNQVRTEVGGATLDGGQRDVGPIGDNTQSEPSTGGTATTATTSPQDQSGTCSLGRSNQSPSQVLCFAFWILGIALWRTGLKAASVN